MGKLALVFAAPLLWAQSPSPARQPVNDLLTIKRLCVEKFVGDESNAAQAREIAIASVFALKRYAVTENCDKADAILKGGVTEKAGQKTRAESEGASFGSSSGGASAAGNTGSAGFGAVKGGNNEGLYSSETKWEASVTLRIVTKDGDVVWAYTQTSPGGKAKGAIPDAIERAVRQLSKEVEKSAESVKSP